MRIFFCSEKKKKTTEKNMSASSCDGVDLRSVRCGARSTLFASKCGMLFRKYHDTDAWSGPLPTTSDEQGVRRCAGRQRVDVLCDEAWRDASSSSSPPSRIPPHLQNAADVLREGPESIDVVARRCGVKTSTAWSYVCKVVEVWPSLSRQAMALVHPRLLRACQQDGVCMDGSLSAVMRCVEEKTDLLVGGEWRMVDDHYAHLRLTRLCLQTGQKRRKLPETRKGTPRRATSPRESGTSPSQR